MASIPNITKLVEMLNKVAPGNNDIDDDLMMIYHGTLHDVPDEVLKDAAMLHISKEETAWLPSPGELRGLCKRVTKMTPPTYCGDALEMRDQLTGKGYWAKLVEYDKHISECEICTEPQQNILPRIPAEITDVAKRLGG